MSKVTKQNSVLKEVHKDELKSTTKLTANGGLKEEKRKIGKEIGVDEKKSEKKPSTKSTLNGKSEKGPEKKTKTESKVRTETKTRSETKIKTESKPKSRTESKSMAVQNGKSVQKVSSVDKSDKKRSSSTDKRSMSIEKRSSSTEKSEEKRPKDKVSSKPKDATRSKVKTGESSSVVKSVSKRQSVPLKASHAIGAKANASTSISSKNVMNQVHNVTVSSPPPVRREIGAVETESEQQRTEQTIMEYEQIQRQKHKEQQIQQKELEEKQQRERREKQQKLEEKERIRQQQQQQQQIEQPKQQTEAQNGQQPEQSESLPKRGRTRTRTLEESEIVLLKPNPNSNSVSISNGSEPQSLVNESSPVEIKPPVSFEVILDGAKNANKSSVKMHESIRSVEPVADNGLDASDNESEDYEDDFESYESDFESEIPDEDDTDESDDDDEESQEETTISSGESDTDDNVVSTASRHPFETGHSIENSEFDSGSFELKVLSGRARDRNEPTAAINRREKQIEMQIDSGIENYSNTVNALIPTQNGQMNSLDHNNKTFDNISDIETEGVNSLETANKVNSGKINKNKSRLAKRGEELLSKITLDIMNYVLFDSKPIPYEVFMKIYGNSNTAQVAVQTHNDRIDQECQSDAIAIQTTWSQYPISFYTEHIGRFDFDDYKIGCGSVAEQNIDKSTENLDRTCEHSLKLIRNMTVKTIATDDAKDEKAGKPIRNIDYENLNRFLLESEMTLSRILNVHAQKRAGKLNEAVLPISNGFLTLNPNINRVNKRIHRTFATDALPGFLFTLHRDSDSELNVIAMWNLVSLHSPVCLLSVWSKVLCLEIHPKIKDIVFAGLDDGSIAVWDYSESKYWHPNIDGEIKRLVPSQITTPTFDNKKITDFGRCISIRGLPIAADTELLNGYDPKQMCSLHECGLLILWTVLSNATGVYTDLSNKRIDHQSIWSKVKLIQNKAIDLRSSVRQMVQLKMSRPTSKSFDKTRSYFESELFSDSALQELHEMNAIEEKILTNFRCTAIELTSEGILISTNENFLLFGRKSFKNESFRRIQIDSNRSVRVESMVALTGFDDDIVIIALNNGAVKSLCCDQNIEQIDDSQANSDIEESSSSISSLTPPTGNGKASNVSFPIETFDYSMASPSNGPVQVALAAPLQAGTGFFANNTGPSFGKSCTIQSLVQSERKIYDEMQAMHHLENMEYKAPLETVPIKLCQRSIRSTQLMSGQTILNNSMDAFSTLSRQYLVQLIKSRKLITLRKNRLRIYDLVTNEIVNVPAKQVKFTEVTATTADQNEECLILLNSEGIVELHQITVEPNSC
ncbi:uncharacterized protein LOC129574888 [Sitodiplosis mosellana]|uniref:uncharacterized protein LOC129574888 n=1 Tax=Sitodiplosis mosellana TaxID=263140 RepID=UPI002443DE9F|nr:uncharacterized protein LOC129574888 [Sitodiplosis mosellana]